MLLYAVACLFQYSCEAQDRKRLLVTVFGPCMDEHMGKLHHANTHTRVQGRHQRMVRDSEKLRPGETGTVHVARLERVTTRCAAYITENAHVLVHMHACLHTV